MASFHPPSSASSARPTSYASAPMATSHAPPGTFAPGTKVQVGSHRVIIEKYLSEGGFAHVYVVRVPTSDGKTRSAVLKRVAVPDKDNLANMRTEVETMKKLKGHKHIVTYIDSHASQLKGGGYEVFLLMEYCDGGGLIDFMNTRLKVRLTEPEILKIFSDTAEGVACMHYLKPPLLHRDLKVENILISGSSSSKIYKLCDFGSSAPPRPAASSAAEGRLIEDDVQRHTTLQYRSPEMIDVYQKRPIDEKSDIWALGVLLYKLCYYTTPFEQQGQMAILTASFKYPGSPKFSDNLKKLIASMLAQDPRKRPNIYEVLREVCSMRGKEVPIKDIYATRTHSEIRNNQQLPDVEPNVKSPSQIGAFHAPPEQVKLEIPNVTPMRRGRPTSSSQRPATNKPMPGSVPKNDKDPFAALDSPSFATRAKAVDDLSARFPPAEQFSLLQSRDSAFQFGSPSDTPPALNERLTNALADEAFAAQTATANRIASRDVNSAAAAKAAALRKDRRPDTPEIKSLQSPPIETPLPQRPKMVSTGTMTSQASSPKEIKIPPVSSRPIWRVPPPRSTPPNVEPAPNPNQREGSDKPLPRRPQDPVSSNSQDRLQESLRSPNSSRPSLESVRPALLDLPHIIHRSKSADESSMSPTKSKFPKADAFPTSSQEDTARRKADPSNRLELTSSTDDAQDPNVPSNVDFLRSMEDEDASKAPHRRSSSINRLKHASLPSMPKNMFGGRFGNAYRRFEAGSGSGRNSSPEKFPSTYDAGTIGGSSAQFSQEDSAIDETEDLPPEMRRELERRRLSLEEKRVAEAAAAYRQQLGNGEPRAIGITRASTIQNRVASLLDESGRLSPVKKTAEGYGKYTDSHTTANASQSVRTVSDDFAPAVTRNESTGSVPLVASSLQRAPRKPIAPPKPKAFRTGGPAPTPSNETVDVVSGDVESEFSKRYPSLSLDLVETEIQQSHKLP